MREISVQDTTTWTEDQVDFTAPIIIIIIIIVIIGIIVIVIVCEYAPSRPLKIILRREALLPCSVHSRMPLCCSC